MAPRWEEEPYVGNCPLAYCSLSDGPFTGKQFPGETGKTWNTELPLRRSSSDHWGVRHLPETVPINIDGQDVEHRTIASSITLTTEQQRYVCYVYLTLPTEVHTSDVTISYLFHEWSVTEHQLPGTDPVMEKNIRHGFSRKFQSPTWITAFHSPSIVARPYGAHHSSVFARHVDNGAITIRKTDTLFFIEHWPEEEVVHHHRIG
ncbi:hypothetical protein DPMN_134628 [Dreissena polymorpha]|uniref:Uncharacterized protein n=1 Tax=Dreissena polymorpha TaxID=45954 RepID=A0A9D4FZB6_DREPO|nr:hypothetical protein DPMN_134628 [Dreissena polymorpha]